MQRILSLQMARGIGESSEFVTKRMCFSFLFSVGFLCLLCGFLLGRFATQRATEFRVEKKRLELAGNGLDNTEYLQKLLLQQLEGAPLDTDFQMNWKSFNLKHDEVRRTIQILSNLSTIHEVIEYQSCITASIRGSREPDRYVVLSIGGESIGIALKLAKLLNEIQEEHNWKPRRSLIFCLFMGPSNSCSDTLSSFTRHRIMAYIVIHDQALQGNGPFIVSGSDVVKSMILETASNVKNLFSYKDQLISLNIPYNTTISCLNLDMPHAVLSFMNNNMALNEHDHERELRKIILAQIITQTVWRLSECLVMKQNPNHFNETVSKMLESINNTELLEIKEKIQETLVKLLTNFKIFNGKIDTIDSTNSLDTRILNDSVMDLDRTFFCSDIKFQSIINGTESSNLNREPLNTILKYLNEMTKCYEIAIQLVRDR